MEPSEDQTLFDLLCEEASREVKEELGYDVPSVILRRQAQVSLLVAGDVLRIAESPVDSVHLGLPIVLDIGEDPNSPEEFVGVDGECIAVRWLNLEDLTPELISNMENWSAAMAQSFVNLHKENTEMYQQLVQAKMGMDEAASTSEEILNTAQQMEAGIPQ